MLNVLSHVIAYTHGHDGKSFVDERSRIERFEEILREKTLSEFDIDQFEAYYQAAGGEKKRRVFGIGSEAKGYCEQTLCVSCGKTSSSASHELCLAFAIFDIVDDVGCFKNSWLMFGTMDVLDIIMCLNVAMFGIVDGFNVSHKNRLIKPFWRVWNTAGSDGCDVIGVLEANFVEPAHDKQGFERTIVLARLEAYLQVIQKYWSSNYHFIGHAKRRNVMNTIVSPDQKEPNAYSAPTIKSCSPFSSNVGNTACHDDRSKLKSTPVKREMGPVHSSIKDSSVQKASHVCVGTRKVPQPVQVSIQARHQTMSGDQTQLVCTLNRQPDEIPGNSMLLRLKKKKKICSPFSSNVGYTTCHDDTSKSKYTVGKHENTVSVHSSVQATNQTMPGDHTQQASTSKYGI
ncbi:hypothetical protein T459_29803 [Capsicum annuum]|uniref:Morc S5 domain-containing protein n=1 Tax=Capsicum annuum TaxID=4072 RepID=A0A2G2Y6M5_CAPAN|nr:hypothetical protein T459_29803 [Capsicum annuum]